MDGRTLKKINRTFPLRSVKEFQEIIRRVRLKNMQRGKDIPTSRITQAIARQYKKYPQLLKELEGADLK